MFGTSGKNPKRITDDGNTKSKFFRMHTETDLNSLKRKNMALSLSEMEAQRAGANKDHTTIPKQNKTPSPSASSSSSSSSSSSYSSSIAYSSPPSSSTSSLPLSTKIVSVSGLKNKRKQSIPSPSLEHLGTHSTLHLTQEQDYNVSKNISAEDELNFYMAQCGTLAPSTSSESYGNPLSQQPRNEQELLPEQQNLENGDFYETENPKPPEVTTKWTTTQELHLKRMAEIARGYVWLMNALARDLKQQDKALSYPAIILAGLATVGGLITYNEDSDFMIWIRLGFAFLSGASGIFIAINRHLDIPKQLVKIKECVAIATGIETSIALILSMRSQDRGDPKQYIDNINNSIVKLQSSLPEFPQKILDEYSRVTQNIDISVPYEFKPFPVEIYHSSTPSTPVIPENTDDQVNYEESIATINHTPSKATEDHTHLYDISSYPDEETIIPMETFMHQKEKEEEEEEGLPHKKV